MIRLQRTFAILAALGLFGCASFLQQFGLARIENDHVVIDRHIRFANDSDEILEDSFEIVDDVATLLKRRSDIASLHVVGHTDATGSHDHNMELSERRAAAVETALRERGVTQAIDHRGAGETEPLCEDATPECNARNRRVELRIEFGS